VINESDLLRFLEGECTPEEARVIQAWIAADPKRAKLLEDLRAVWQLTGKTSRRWGVAAAWERLRRLRGHTPIPPSVRRTRRREPAKAARSRSVAWGVRLAAAVVLAIAGAIYGYRGRADAREYTTAPGQRAELSLRDGSRVILSVDTRLRVPRGYGVRERVVELDGEAYFVARHDAQRPLIVRTRHGIAEDLGTEFGVRAYRHENDVQVVVRAGSVAIRDPQNADSVLLTLHAGDRGVVDAHGRATLATRVSLDRYLSWAAGRLVFDDDRLDAVIPQLARWYDLDIHLDDPSLGAERITIVFTTESPDEALATLAKVLDLRMLRTGRSVRFVSPRPRR
jgi:transmembrane sensor